jgi:hypothetical protein
VDWTMIGAIGEILGAVGVIVTLIYLARQISENTVALQREAKLRRQHSSRHRSWRLARSCLRSRGRSPKWTASPSPITNPS